MSRPRLDAGHPPDDARRIVDSMDAPDEPIEPTRTSRVRIAVAVLVAVAVTAAFLAGTIGALFRGGVVPGATTPPNAGLLAVIDATGALSTMDGRGGSVVAHEAAGVALQFPAWSPDGTRIAATGSTGSGGVVEVFDAGPTVSGTTTAPPATSVYASPDRPPFYLSWSPDSSRVTFLTTEPDGIALRVAPADASAEATVVREGAPFYWDWVDSGRLMVHVGSAGPEAFVGDVDLEGAGLDGTDVSPGFFRAPAATADGSLRAYVAAAADGTESVVLAAADGAQRHAIPVAGNVAFGFDPGGSSLAFIASGDSASAASALPIGPLRVLDAATGEARLALDGAVVAFFWSPDGRTIAALQLVPNAPPSVDEARRPIGPAVATLSGVGLTAAAPPGITAHLVFIDAAAVAAGAPAGQVVRSARDVRLGELFAFQLIPYFDQYALSHRVWSPDSATIVLPVADGDGPTRIVTFPADGSAPTRIADGVAAFWSP